MRRRRRWLAVLSILASLAVSLVIAAWPGKSTFTISPETTYITEPLDKHGYIDYVTALNERLRKNITPETNANVLIWRALGPRIKGSMVPIKYFQWLGTEPPPENGEYLLDWQDYTAEHSDLDDGHSSEWGGAGPAPASVSAAELKDFPDVPSKPWKAADNPELANWLERNQKPLALVVKATRRPEYYNPLEPRRSDDSIGNLVCSLLPNVQRCRILANALACRAMLCAGEGKVDDAWQDLLACHRLGRLVGRGGSAVEGLVGIALERVATQADIAFVQHVKLTSDQILAALDDLRRLPPMATVADTVDLGERFVMLDLILSLAREGPSALDTITDFKNAPPKHHDFRDNLFTRSINWDPALRKANQWFNRYVEALRTPDRKVRSQKLATLDQELDALGGHFEQMGLLKKALMGPTIRNDLIGDMTVRFLIPAITKFQTAAERCEQEQRNARLAFALAAYQRDHGSYPEKLQELAPKYLPKIPDDLFSGKPLIYRLEEKGYLLYSIGMNGTDDDGRGPDDDPPGDDLIIRMPARQAPGKQ